MYKELIDIDLFRQDEEGQEYSVVVAVVYEYFSESPQTFQDPFIPVGITIYQVSTKNIEGNYIRLYPPLSFQELAFVQTTIKEQKNGTT